MSLRTRSNSFINAAALSLVALMASQSFAGVVDPPDLHFTLQVNNDDPIHFYPPATQTGPTTWNWQGSYEADDWAMPSFTINADTDPMISSNITLINNTLSTQTYTITVSLPVAPFGPGSLMDGSVGGSITDANGNGSAMIAATAGSSFYQGTIDGTTVATLLNDPFSASPANSGGTAIFGPASFGQPVPILGPSVSVDIGIILQFTLTPGDSMAATSFFRVEPVPGPSVLALLGLAGVAGRSRRRK